MTDNEYITFEEFQVEGRKTPICLIRSVSSGEVLGEIKWWGAWRQFAFFPHNNTIWNPGCLESVKMKIAEMMVARIEVRDSGSV